MGTLLFDRVIDDANSSGVVIVDGCWWLWMPKFVESQADDFDFLGIEEEGTYFSFGSGCGNKFEDGVGNMDSAIEFDWVAINGYAAKEKIDTGMAMCARCREIWGIRIDIKDHIRGAVAALCIRMSPHVGKELFDSLLGVLSRSGLLSGDVG